ncbi:hypothetical protein JD844_005018, partial [Phrynosoma platyrhinos]
LKEYQQKNSPGLTSGAKKKRKGKEGSRPETPTNDGRESPENIQNILKVLVSDLNRSNGVAIPSLDKRKTTNPKMQNEKEVAGICCKEGNLQGAKLDQPEQASPLDKRWEQSPGEKGGPSPRPLLRRTPVGTQRNCNTSFKSPVPSPRACQPANKDTLQREIEELKNKSIYLDHEIAHLSAEGYSLEELESHIALLHEYNEIKDTGQMLLGRLGKNQMRNYVSVIRGVTTKELYPVFDLDLND